MTAQVRISSPVAASHSFTVWSTPAEAMRRPSGLYATPQNRRRSDRAG